MLDFDHIITVLIKDWQTIPVGTFLSGGVYAWMGYKVSSLAKSEGGKFFWLTASLLLLRDILASNTILFDSMTYVAVAIFFTHLNLITDPIKNVIQKIQQRSYNRYKKCESQNRSLEIEKENERRAEQKAQDDRKKQLQQEKFLNNLSKKLNSF